MEISGQFTKGQLVLEHRSEKLADPDFRPNIKIIRRMDEDLIKDWLMRGFGYQNAAIAGK